MMTKKVADHLNTLLQLVTKSPHLKISGTRTELCGMDIHDCHTLIAAIFARHMPTAVDMEIRAAASECRSANINSDRTYMQDGHDRSGCAKIAWELSQPEINLMLEDEKQKRHDYYERYRILCEQGVAQAMGE